MLSEAQAHNAPENVLSMGEILSPNASYGRVVGNTEVRFRVANLNFSTDGWPAIQEQSWNHLPQNLPGTRRPNRLNSKG